MSSAGGDGPAEPAVAPGGLRIGPRVHIPDDELAWRFSRSSGPGGQHVNTTDSKAELRWDVATTVALTEHLRARALERLADRLVDGSVVVVAQEFRSQHRNREAAKERLVELVRDAIAPPPAKRRPTRPSRAAVQRRIDDKKRRGATKRNRQVRDD